MSLNLTDDEHEYEITDVYAFGDLDECHRLVTPFTSGFDVKCFCGHEFSVLNENDNGEEQEFSFTCEKCLRSHWALVGEISVTSHDNDT